MKANIISIDVNHGNKKSYINKIVDLIIDKKGGYVCFSNVHMLIEAHDDKDFAIAVNNATFAFPDGFPIAKSFKYLYNIEQERIAGMDFLPEFLEVCNNYKFRVAFIGSTSNILDDVLKKINKNYKNVILTNLISPPFNESWDNSKYIDKLNKSKTDVVFVALGCPKQEKWMYANYKKTNAFLFGIGGALVTFVGSVNRAPLWMQNNGLEWLYRLYKEPKRMLKRYTYTNLKFIYLLFKTIVKK
jgi:N-acetylglucosaminyldiphosphoundecaprenol N-acetyl-beta-D-mannosaminyltransferase